MKLKFPPHIKYIINIVIVYKISTNDTITKNSTRPNTSLHLCGRQIMNLNVFKGEANQAKDSSGRL